MEKTIKGIIYRLVKTLANISLRFFYRGIDIEGKENIPNDGPIIYAVNHQNAFLDAVIVGALSPIPTYFMTRSDVFKPPFDWFLDALKMMPIYRIRDGYKSLSKNDAIFETCSKILFDKQALLIFPEGNHGLEYYLRPLTKGISRISLQSQVATELSIKIIPVGLNYFDHFNSGHKLIIKYGEPILVKDSLPLYEEHKHRGLRQFTEIVSAGMQKTLVISQDSETYPEQKKIFQRKHEGLSFEELRHNLDNHKYHGTEKRYPLLATIGKLFSIPNLPPILLTQFIIKKKVSQKIFIGSIKIAALILLFPIWFLLCFIMCWFFGGLKFAGLVLLVQLVTLVIRRELVRLNH